MEAKNSSGSSARWRRLAALGAAITFGLVLVALFFGDFLRSRHAYLINYILPVALLMVAFLAAILLRAAVAAPKSALRRQLLVFGGVVIAAASVSELIIVAPIERIHFLKYGSLAFFLFFSRFRGTEHSGNTTLFALGISSLTGIAEECIQHFLPGRIFDPRDICLNVAGAIIGCLMALVSARSFAANRPSE